MPFQPLSLVVLYLALALQPPATDSSLKLEVGIEECLHIEFEYDR